MNKYARYPEYKDSGVPWLGEIPSHWQNKRLKYTITNVSEKVDAQTSDLRYFGLENIQSFTGKLLSDVELVSEGVGNTFKKDDVLFGKLRPYLAKVYLAKDDGLSSTEALIFRATENIDPNFLFYYCLSPDFISAVNGTTFGSKMPRASWDDIASFKMVYPSIEEQAQIANFLDHELGKIDALIDKQQLLLDKLAEQRSAVITQAVTKGLNPNAEMKDSGVAWLGDVPSHWKVKRLRFGIEINPVKSELKIKDDTIVSFVPMESVKYDKNLDVTQERLLEEVYKGYTYFKDNDIVLAKITPCFENGKSAIAKNLMNGIGFGTTELHVLRVNDSFNEQYLYYLIKSEFFMNVGESEMLGAGGQKRISEEFVKNFLVPFPTFNEQIRIAEFIDQETQKIDNMTDTVNRTIERLKEYRSTLITQAVTGKIDVRHHNNNKQDV